MNYEQAVSDWVVKVFLKEGVQRVFLYPGGTVAPLINSLLECGIHIEVFKSEQGAVYAALACARLSGRPQVAMVTSGPGLTNAVTPLADAFFDSTPLILISGQIATRDLRERHAVRQRGFQEVNTVRITESLCKKSVCLMSVEEVLEEIPNAFQLSILGRPGPVVIDFPMDLQRQTLGVEPEIEVQEHKVRDPLPELDYCDDLEEIAAVAASSKKIVVVLGHGALCATQFDLYSELAEMLHAVVVTSFLGIGAYDTKSARWLGYIGHTGHRAANLAVYESDLVIVLGSRLDVRQTGTEVNAFAPEAKVVWVNNDSAEVMNPRVLVDWPLQMDVGAFVLSMITRLQCSAIKHDEKWQEGLRYIRDARSEDQPKKSASFLQPRPVLDKLVKKINTIDDVIVVTGVGCHQHWAARHLPFVPNQKKLLTSAGHGAMGYDLPSAIGAAIASPSSRIICVVGDGSLLMNIQELAALSERNLDVHILLFNNSRLGIVSQFQQITWDDDPTTGTFGGPDFVAVSEGFGVPAKKVRSERELPEILGWWWDINGPALLDVEIDQTANIVPMLLGGQVMGEMWDEGGDQ